MLLQIILLKIDPLEKNGVFCFIKKNIPKKLDDSFK